MVAINTDYFSYLSRFQSSSDLQLDALMERIIGDMPDDVAQVMFDDIHKDFDYE